MRPTFMLAAGVMLSALALVPGSAGAQQQPRGPETIEIRGQVPTPQVVTVRPREVPRYSRQVLVPEFYDRTFWPSAMPAYQLVSQRQVIGAALTGAGTIPRATAFDLEIEAIRRELDQRRQRLDEIADDVRQIGRPQPAPPQGGAGAAPPPRPQ